MKTQFASTDTVERIHTATGSHIEPPLDPSWPAVDKLRWNAAVVLADTGLKLRVHVAAGSMMTKYAVTGNGFSGQHLSYNEAWQYITHLGTGAEMMNQQNISEALAAHTDIIEIGD